MIQSLVLGTILGGLAAFLWSSVSWEVIGWHEKTMRTLQNEDEVSAVIASHTTQSGTFLLPAGPSQQDMNPVEKKAAQLVLMEKMQKGPVMFAAIRRSGFSLFTRGLVTQALIQMASALLLTWLLLQTSGLRYAARPFSRRRRTGRERHRRSAQLELMGLFRCLHAGQPNRLYNHLVSRRSGYRQSGKGERLSPLRGDCSARARDVPPGALFRLSLNLPKSILGTVENSRTFDVVSVISFRKAGDANIREQVCLCENPPGSIYSASSPRMSSAVLRSAF
jgi:hypothetical protein